MVPILVYLADGKVPSLVVRLLRRAAFSTPDVYRAMLTSINPPVRQSMFGFAIAVAIGLSAIASAQADGLLDSPEELEEGVRSAAALASDAIFPPFGRILPIRHDGLCGLRFTEFHREANPKEPARLYGRATEPIFAQYEWYRADGDKISSFQIKTSGKDNVLRGSLAFMHTLYGPWYYAVGDNILKCARSQFLWMYPTGVVFA